MIVYHVTKSASSFSRILDEGLTPGTKPGAWDRRTGYVYVSTKQLDLVAADVFGPDTNEAYFMELEVDDDIQWEEDPASAAEAEIYSGKGARWLRYPGTVPVSLVNHMYVGDVQGAIMRGMYSMNMIGKEIARDNERENIRWERRDAKRAQRGTRKQRRAQRECQSDKWYPR